MLPEFESLRSSIAFYATKSLVIDGTKEGVATYGYDEVCTQKKDFKFLKREALKNAEACAQCVIEFGTCMPHPLVRSRDHEWLFDTDTLHIKCFYIYVGLETIKGQGESVNCYGITSDYTARVQDYMHPDYLYSAHKTAASCSDDESRYFCPSGLPLEFLDVALDDSRQNAKPVNNITSHTNIGY